MNRAEGGLRGPHVAPGTYERPVIMGSGSNTTFTTTINMAGSGNVVVGCDIVGIGAPTYCIDITGQGHQSPMVVEDNDITGCFNGIRTSGPHRDIRNNNIHDNAGTGVFVQEFGDGTSLLDNAFSDNVSADVRCNEGFPQMVGTGNLGDDGPPSCDVCNGCPFD